MSLKAPISFAFPRVHSLPALLPACWSKLLFPGRSPGAEPVRFASVLWLILLPGLLLYPCLHFHLFEPDEGRYAEIPREMLVRGDWLVPYLVGEPYLDKPPLFYWLVMLSYQVFGVHDWAARLVPAVAIHACILLTYLFGRRHVGERPAFWGALFLGLAPGFLSVGRMLVLDGVLTFCVTLSLFAAFEAVQTGRLLRGWWLLAAVACGLGILTKGPVAVLLLVPPLVAYAWLTGTAAWPDRRALLLFAGVVLAVTLPWYVAASVRLPQLPRYFLWEHNVVRFLAPFAHQQPVWFYGPVLLAGMLPASLLLAGFVRFLLSGEEHDAGHRCPELGFLLLAGGWCVLFFTLSDCKLPTYIMPAMPPLALALGYFAVRRGWLLSRWLKSAIVLTFVLLAAGHYVALPWYAWHHSPMSRAEVVKAYCADPATPVICYPRNCDSVAFYLGRDDLHIYRSKETPELISYLLTQPKAVVLFMHRHSLEALRQVLPAKLKLVEETPLCGSAKPGPEGICWMAVVRRQ